MTEWRVYRGSLSGRYYAAKMRQVSGDVWEAVEKHDVTDDIERIVTIRLDEMTAARILDDGIGAS